MKITIISVGKLKEKYLKDGIAEYVKRLSRYCSLTLIEIPDIRAPENLSPAEMEQVKDREGELILKKIGDSQFVITLEIDGAQFSSEKFSQKIEKLGVDGESDIVFLIGGSLGLSDGVKQKSQLKLSFSKMTFPHQLMKLFLVEQIYRAFRIIRNEPYHK
jgi:23S rRNA (pseudouridine1915-N3)-methyltransferase